MAQDHTQHSTWGSRILGFAKQEKKAKASQTMKAPAPRNAPTRNGFGAPPPAGNPGGGGAAFGARPMVNGFGAPPPAGNPGGGGAAFGARPIGNGFPLFFFAFKAS